MMLRLMVLTVSMVYLGTAEGPLRFELKQIEKHTATCVISFEYPEMISASSPEVRDRINARIRRLLLRRSDWPATESGLQSLGEYINAFVKSCELETRPLYEHKLVTISHYTPPILSFKCDAQADLGGVHPFGTTLFVNFDSSTGQPVVITDLLKDGALAKLESVAEEIFRRDLKLSSTQSLSEQGYNFPGDHFRLNDNFGIGESKIVFLFNTYEIAAGAMGAAEITMPYQQIRWLLKPDLHLW